MWTRSDLYSVLGTSNICQAYYRSMSAVLYIYIFKCMHLYRLCLFCTGVRDAHITLIQHTHHCCRYRIRFSAEDLIALHSMCSMWHIICQLFSVYFQYIPLRSGSKFPSALWTFPDAPVLSKPFCPGTPAQDTPLCRVLRLKFGQGHL